MTVKVQTCIACGGQLPPELYLYCTPACSLASRQRKWRELRPGQALPPALYPAVE
jgi:hypothetical protein